MLKIIYFSAILILINVKANAQRFSLTELLKVYDVASDPSSATSAITASFGKQENWSQPTTKKDAHQTTFNWKYTFNGTVRGAIYVYKDDNVRLPVRLAFQFPYNQQYEEYRLDLVNNATLINTFSENGKQTEVYELQNIIFALTVYPKELNIYFNEGRSAPFYKIFIQHKGI